MAPTITVGLGSGEAYYTLQVVAPNGVAAVSTSSCTSSTSPSTVEYQGNGAYAVSLAVYKAYPCTAANQVRTWSGSFAIGASVQLGAPGGTRLLSRKPGSYSTIGYSLPIAGNPGADTYDISYSTNSALNPDGSLVGPADSTYVQSGTANTYPVYFSKPGTYTFVARARNYAAGATPWTAPLALHVYAPFDFSSSTFPDSRGPSYRLRAEVRESSARGRVRISWTKTWTGKAHYHTIGTVHIKSGGVFTKRFTLRHTGKYRLRYHFVGNSTTAPGYVVQKVRITRKVRFATDDGADQVLTAAP